MSDLQPLPSICMINLDWLSLGVPKDALQPMAISGTGAVKRYQPCSWLFSVRLVSPSEL